MTDRPKDEGKDPKESADVEPDSTIPTDATQVDSGQLFFDDEAPTFKSFPDQAPDPTRVEHFEYAKDTLDALGPREPPVLDVGPGFDLEEADPTEAQAIGFRPSDVSVMKAEGSAPAHKEPVSQAAPRQVRAHAVRVVETKRAPSPPERPARQELSAKLKEALTPPEASFARTATPTPSPVAAFEERQSARAIDPAALKDPDQSGKTVWIITGLAIGAVVVAFAVLPDGRGRAAIEARSKARASRTLPLPEADRSYKDAIRRAHPELAIRSPLPQHYRRMKRTEDGVRRPKKPISRARPKAIKIPDAPPKQWMFDPLEDPHEPREYEKEAKDPGPARYPLISIQTHPPRMVVEIDGVMAGLSPMMRPVPPGTKEVQVRIFGPGYLEHKTSLTMNEHNRFELGVSLEKDPAFSEAKPLPPGQTGSNDGSPPK